MLLHKQSVRYTGLHVHVLFSLKPTTSANIGTALAKNGNSVVLVDTDIGLRNLDLLLGLEKSHRIYII